MPWDKLADDAIVEQTAKALIANGINVIIVNTGEEAKNKVLEIIPAGAEVMTVSSTTAVTIGLMAELNESGKYDSVRKKLTSMNRETQGAEMRKLGAAPDWIVGSVHAVTEDGKIIDASASGSQLPGYSYGAAHVVWVVGTQKIVKDFDEGLKRVYEYVLPLENERAKKAYGFESSVSKLLVINKEFTKNRITLIFVKEALGF